MNNNHNPFPHGLPFAPQRLQLVRIVIDNKIFYQQKMTELFGRERVREINESDQPFILPLINYRTNFDVIIFILM